MSHAIRVATASSVSTPSATGVARCSRSIRRMFPMRALSSSHRQLVSPAAKNAARPSTLRAAAAAVVVDARRLAVGDDAGRQVEQHELQHLLLIRQGRGAAAVGVWRVDLIAVTPARAA